MIEIVLGILVLVIPLFLPAIIIYASRKHGNEKLQSWVRVAYFFTLLCLFSLTPEYLQFSLKAKQSEAKSNLGRIYSSQSAYFAEHGFYASTLTGLDVFDGETILWYYAYSLDGRNWLVSHRRHRGEAIVKNNEPLAKGFVGNPESLAVAIGDLDNDSVPDIWVITKSKQLVNVCNDGTNVYTPYPGISRPEGSEAVNPDEMRQHRIKILLLLAWTSMIFSLILMWVLPRIFKRD